MKLQRLERGLLQVEVANRARIPRARLSELENGHVLPTGEELERLASALGVAPGVLSETAAGQQEQ
jgi:transcriptional regulator with XRE-family HTH domain